MRKELGLLLAVGLVLVFTGCLREVPDSNGIVQANIGNSGSSSGSAQAKASFVGVNDGQMQVAVFNTDGTFKIHGYGALFDKDVITGTYTGNAAADGSVTITIQKKLNGSGVLADYSGSDARQNLTISNRKFSMAFGSNTVEYESFLGIYESTYVELFYEAEYTEGEVNYRQTIHFEGTQSGGEFTARIRVNGGNAKKTATGTYTGNPLSDGSISLTVVEINPDEADPQSGNLVPYAQANQTSPATRTITISNGSFTHKIYKSQATFSQDADTICSMEVPIFKSNGTFIDYVSGLPPNNYEGIYATGTYTGNLSTEGGAISMTFVKIAQPSPDNTGSVVLVDCPDDYPQRLLTVSGGNLIETNDDDSQTQNELVKLSF